MKDKLNVRVPFKGKTEEISFTQKRPRIKKKMNRDDLEQVKKQCDGKVKHKTLLAAQECLYMNTDKTLESYKCRYCGYYHHGHRKGGKK